MSQAYIENELRLRSVNGVLVANTGIVTSIPLGGPDGVATYNSLGNAITLTTIGTSGAATIVSNTLNIPNYTGALSGYVPYTGATGPVDLGAYNLTVNSVKIGRGTSTHPTNIAIGNSNTMGIYASTGASNIAIGGNALSFLTTGYENTAIGVGALIGVTTGYYNIGIGVGAGGYNQLGINNIFIGRNSGGNISNGSGNAIIGGWQGNTTTSNNVVLSDGYGNLRYRYDGTNNNFYQNVNFASTIGNGTYTYTLPSANGTLALVGDLSAYVPTSRTLTINGTTYDLSANRSWTIPAGVTSFNTRTGDITLLGTDVTGALGYTPEDIANKSTSTSLGTSNTLYPTQNAVKTYVDSIVAGGIILQGDWNASTNSPDITGTTTTGWAWRVSIDGSTNLGGITDWKVGDLAVKSASGWIKIDNTDGVTSVFGRYGSIVAQSGDYTTAQVTESGNLYYLDSRARASLSAGTGISYSSSTGIISSTITQYTDANARASISLTTTGNSGASTYSSSTGFLNVPEYTLGGLGGVPTSRTLTINGTTYDLSADRAWTITAGVSSVFGRTGVVTAQEGDYSLTQLSDTTITTPSTGQVLKYNGTEWVNSSDSGLTSIGITTSAAALSITNTPLVSNGNIGVNFSGSSTQYVAGDGSLVTFPTIVTQAQNLVTEVYNETGATLTKGTVVYINGGHGNLPTVTKALATGDATSAQTYGVVKTDITNMNNGFVTVIGNVDNLDTQVYAPGTQLYLSPITAGTWTSTKPYAPQHLVYVGIVVRSHPTQGTVEVKIQNGFEMDELHNVSAQNPLNNDGIFYNTTTSLWEKKSISTALGYTPVPTSRTLTINGVTYDLSSDRAWSITAGVSSVSATSPLFSSGGSTPNLTIQAASVIQDGYLSSTDWNTFNSKISGSGTTNFLPKFTGIGTIGNSVAYDGGSSIGINTTSPYASTVFKLDVNGGAIIKNTSGTTAQLVLIDSDPSGGGNNGFVQMTAGGTSSSAYGALQTYYGTSIIGGALRLQPIGGSVLVNKTVDSGLAALQVTGAIQQSSVTTSIVKADSSGVLTSAIAGTDYVAPSTLSGYVPTSRTLTINGTTYDLSADRSWSITAGISSVSGTAPISVSTISGAATVSISQATTSTDGYLSSSDWTTFNNKVPPSRTLTINGTTYDLSTNRSWTITPNINATTTQDYTATAGQTVFTVTGGYTVGQLAVFYNGSKLASNEFTATDGSTFTLATACQVNDIVQAVVSVTGGGIGGSGATGQVAYWNSSGTQTGTNNFYWDNTNVQLGIGTNAPSAGVTSYSTVPATQFKAAGVAPAFTFSNTLLSPTLGCVFGLATGSGQFVTGTAAGDMAIANQSATAGAIVFGTGTTERMRMTSAGTFSIGNTNTTYKLDVTGTGRFTGNVGIGGAPQERLTIAGSNGLAGMVRWTDSATASAFLGITTGGVAYIHSNNNSLAFGANGSNNFAETMRLTGGNVGIGTSSPITKTDFRIDAADSTNGSVANSYPISSFIVNGGGGGTRGLQIGGPTSGVVSPVFLKVYGTSQRFSIIDSSDIERFTISGSGNVGIGTSSPSYQLDVQNGSSPSLRVRNNAAGGTATLILETANTFSGTSQAYVQCIGTAGGGQSQLVFATAGASGDSTATERARITSGGQVIIGNTNSLYTNTKLAVSQSSANMTAEIRSNWGGDAATSALIIVKYDSDNGSSQVFQRFANASGSNANGQINGNGAAQVAFGSWSDSRLKDNIENLPSQLSNIMELRPVEFDYKNGSGHQIGFIAQEMKEVYPDAVGEDSDGFLTITGWSKTEARLVKAIQELSAQIEELKAKIN